ncbi:MAG: hypothetical protein ACYC7E_19375 [Armatimonadota bacterium]
MAVLQWPVLVGVIVSFAIVKFFYVQQGFERATEQLLLLRELPIAYAYVKVDDGSGNAKVLLLNQGEKKLPYFGKHVFPYINMTGMRFDDLDKLEEGMFNEFKGILTEYHLDVTSCQYALESTVKFYDDQPHEDWHWAHVFKMNAKVTDGLPDDTVLVDIANVSNDHDVPLPFLLAIEQIGNCTPPYTFWVPRPDHYLILRSRPH